MDEEEKYGEDTKKRLRFPSKDGNAGDARSKQKSRLKEFSQSRCIVFVFIIEDGTSVMRLQSHNIREKPMQSLQT